MFYKPSKCNIVRLNQYNDLFLIRNVVQYRARQDYSKGNVPLDSDISVTPAVFAFDIVNSCIAIVCFTPLGSTMHPHGLLSMLFYLVSYITIPLNVYIWLQFIPYWDIVRQSYQRAVVRG